MKKGLTVIGIVVCGWLLWHILDETSWQAVMGAQHGHFDWHGFSVQISEVPRASVEWQVSIMEPGHFDHWRCRGFKSSKEAGKVAAEVIEDYRDGNIDHDDWEKGDG
jgi:hypothetical protein